MEEATPVKSQVLAVRSAGWCATAQSHAVEARTHAGATLVLLFSARLIAELVADLENCQQTRGHLACARAAEASRPRPRPHRASAKPVADTPPRAVGRTEQHAKACVQEHRVFGKGPRGAERILAYCRQHNLDTATFRLALRRAREHATKLAKIAARARP